MITNPSTLGLFETRIGELLDAVHAAGALAYMDGANLNAILGRFKPGEAGFDVMHFNVHKTFSTPHGGGGPGAGPVGVGEKLLPFLPSPRVLRAPDGGFRLERPDERPTSIGRLRTFVGNTGVLVRAFAYIWAHGGTGLREVSDDAVLAANYLKSRLAGHLRPSRTTGPASTSSWPRPATLKKETGVRTLDIAKRLIDYGFHPPTIYFPLIVEEGHADRADRDRADRDARCLRRRAHRDRARGARDPGDRDDRAPHGPGQAARRGDRRPPAQPALAADDRGADAMPRLTADSEPGPRP